MSYLWIYQLPLPVLGFGVTGLTVIVGLAFSLIAERFGWTVGPGGNEAAGFRHAAVGVVYAVALALIVVAVQNRFDQVEQAVETEANQVGDLFATFTGLSPDVRDHLQHELIEYLNSVVNVEWPLVQEGRKSPQTEALARHLIDQIVVYRPKDAHEEDLYPHLVTDVHHLLDARRTRLAIGLEGLNGPTWGVIVLGAIITLFFASLFHAERRRVQLLTMALTSAMFGLMIFLILAMDHPLLGEFSVSPDAMRQEQARLEQIMRTPTPPHEPDAPHLP
ncbi:MAG TPA: DUF4239 domain-containing protein [Vicinamibacterales bacterium]|nr:DUF4239 domain-containing protein [Vicinamibacterales bacterium]